MATIKVMNVAQANPEAPVSIKLGIINEPEKPINAVGIPGPQGPKGDTGPKGDIGLTGPQGPKGDTPIKGVDYFTTQEINEITAPLATKIEVQTAINEAASGLLKRSIVQELPTTEIDNNTIYMVPKEGDIGDIYDEYLYINGVWEHIGSTDIDLSGYATEQWVNNNQLNSSSSIMIDNNKITTLFPLNYFLLAYRDGDPQHRFNNGTNPNGLLLPYDTLTSPSSNTDDGRVRDYDTLIYHLKHYGYCYYESVKNPDNPDGIYGPTKQQISNSLGIEIYHIWRQSSQGNFYKYEDDSSGIDWLGCLLLGKDRNNSIWLLNLNNNAAEAFARKSLCIGLPAPSDIPNLLNRNYRIKNYNDTMTTIDTMLGEIPTINYLTNSDILAIWNGENEE